MSILIKGVDMPKDCVSCRWHARWGCEITLHCEECGLFVAFLRPYSGGGQPGEMMGRWHGVKGGDDDDGKR